MTERGNNKMYVVNWDDPHYPVIEKLLFDPDEKGQSITACREEIIQHFQELKKDAQGQIRKARHTPRHVIEMGNYR